MSPHACFAAGVIVAGLAVVTLRPQWVTGHPRLVLSLLLAITAAAAFVLVRFSPLGFTIDVDPASERLIRRSDPGIPSYELAKRDFGSDDVYVIAMETTNVFTKENLDALSRLTRRLRALPRVAKAESLARVLSVQYDEERDMVRILHFLEEVPSEAAELEDLRKRALADPIYTKTLISQDGRTAAINVTFQPTTDAEFVHLDLDGKIEALLDEEEGEGRRFFVAGRPHVRSQAYHLMVGDMARFVPAAVAVAAAVLWLMSGSLWGMLIPLIACLAATLWVYGAMALLQIDINLITLVLGPMMICIGSVYGVHVHERYRLIAGNTEDSAAALECLLYVRTPVLMAGFTTCIGFGALLLADIPATNELGAFSVFGVASITLISLTGVPAAFVLLAPRLAVHAGRRRASSRYFELQLERGLAVLGRVVVTRPNSVLAVWAVLTGLALVAIPRIVIDTDFITFFVKDSRVRTDFAAVNRLLTGAVSIYVPISGKEEGVFREPETLRAIEALQEEIEALPGVSAVLSLVDFVKVANRALNDGSGAAGRIPDTREEVAEAMFLLPKRNLRRFVNSNHSRGNLIVRSGQSGSEAVRILDARIGEALRRSNLSLSFETNVVGNAILMNRSADGIAGNQTKQVGLAAATIFVLICIVFRSFRVGLIAMVPNIVPVLLFFAVLGLGLATLSTPTSLIGSIVLGIAIDDTMHFLVAYRSRRAQGHSPPAAAQFCIQQVGRPIVMTSIMLIVGFLVIVISGFGTLKEFGYLTALTMMICLCTDLLLLPALLVRAKA